LQQWDEEEHACSSHTGEKDESRNKEGTTEGESQGADESEIANFLKESKKEKQEYWMERFANLEQRYDLLASFSQSLNKGTTSLADGLFSNTVSPFTNQITSYRLPDKFKMLDIPVYSELGDPVEHLKSLCAHAILNGTPNEIACRAFPLTLVGGPREWFRTLPSQSVINFESLAKIFLSQFMAGVVRKKPVEQLMTIKQGPPESLKSYLQCFNQERLAAESQSGQFVHCAIY
jgi:hypothetical protein